MRIIKFEFADAEGLRRCDDLHITTKGRVTDKSLVRFAREGLPMRIALDAQADHITISEETFRVINPKGDYVQTKSWVGSLQIAEIQVRK